MAHEGELLDATGLVCPMPVLRARKRLLALPAGSVLTVWADDPATARDMSVFCQEAGHELLATGCIEGKLVFTIKSGGKVGPG